MTPQQKVADARVRLHKLETDCRLTPAEVDSIRRTVLGVGVARPNTLGQAHRYICALEERLNDVCNEIPS